MTVYSIKIEVETPVQISDGGVGRVIRHRTKYIPPSSLKGAILSMLYRDYGVEEVSQESSEPTIVVHPAYITVSGVESRVAHPLLYRCKLCEDGAIMVHEKLSDKSELQNLRLEDLAPPTICQGGHIYSIKSIGGRLVLFERDRARYREVKLKSIELSSIGINRAFGGVERGMLYSYTAIPPGMIFTSMIFDPQDRLRDWGIAEGEHRVLIGRGVSRGMGAAKLELRRADDYIERRTVEIRDLLVSLDGLVLLRAKTPVVDASGGLSIPGLDRFDIYEGINFISTGSGYVRGFSIYTGLPKLQLKGLAEGSLFFYRVVGGDYEMIAGGIARAEVEGVGPFRYAGANFVEVYTDVRYIS